MKTLANLLALVATLFATQTPLGQGMPPEARDNIHTLFNHHDTVQRTVNLTDTGYTALTESTNPEVAAALQAHVRQMEQRLDSGLMVRRWDPAFAEYVAHYRDITHQIEPTQNGLRITVTGKTPTAIRVAQNHARVISEFAADGWEAHDRRHPAVADAPEEPKPSSATAAASPESSPAPAGCCQARPTPAAKAPTCCRRASTTPATPGCCRRPSAP